MKFLFLVNDLNIGGGIASALLNLSNTLIKEWHNVDFLNFTNIKTLPKNYDNKIKLLEIDDRLNLYNLKISDIKKAKGLKKIKLFFLAILKKLTHKTSIWQKICFRKSFYSGYDVAVAFRQAPLNYWFIGNRTDAKVKIGFWHGDPDFMVGIDNWAYTIKYLDYVACVSNAVRDKMIIRYKQFSDKMQTVYNIFDSHDIIEKANEFSANYSKNIFNIVTVARISFWDKQVDIIPSICKKLKESRVEFRWTIVGGGDDYNRLVSLIKENNVNDCIELVGNKENPYPYIKQADLLVLTSKTESYGIVLTEALVLDTPCVAGYYSALSEIIEDGVNGVIAENSIDGIYEKIEQVMKNKGLYNKIKQGAINYKYDYKLAYNQLMELSNGKV